MSIKKKQFMLCIKNFSNNIPLVNSISALTAFYCLTFSAQPFIFTLCDGDLTQRGSTNL